MNRTSGTGIVASGAGSYVWRWAIGVVALVVPLHACSGTDTAEWKEEVKLHDGQVIVLERRATIGSSGFPTQHRGSIRHWEICYRPMNVYWKSGGVFRPEIFDIVEGIPYVMVPVPGCTSCQLYDYPEKSAMFFRFGKDGWKRIPFSEFPRELDTNLLRRALSGRSHRDDVKGFMTLAAKAKWDGDPKWVGGTFRQWKEGERGRTCEVCKAGPRGRITGSDPAYEFSLSNGRGCPGK